jgi:hypothetical protein
VRFLGKPMEVSFSDALLGRTVLVLLDPLARPVILGPVSDRLWEEQDVSVPAEAAPESARPAAAPSRNGTVSLCIGLLNVMANLAMEGKALRDAGYAFRDVQCAQSDPRAPGLCPACCARGDAWARRRVPAGVPDRPSRGVFPGNKVQLLLPEKTA